jgi:hypothetical protein
MRVAGVAAAVVLMLACRPRESWSLRDVLVDAADTLFKAFPEAEAPEVTARRTPRLSPNWETGRVDYPAIPDSLLEALERPGLKRLPPSPEAARDTSIAILSMFEPRVRGDSVFIAVDWLFPTEESFFGQEYELVYHCRRTSCARVSFKHVGTLN